MTDFFEKTLSSERLFEGKIINLRRDTVELMDGKQAFREVVEHPGGVSVIPYTEDGQVILVRQFRYPYGKALLEIPAGKLEPGEDPAETGRRELKEEVGATAGRYELLGQVYPTVAYDTEIIWIYLARDLNFDAQSLDEGEFLDLVKMPFHQAVELVMNGEIKDAKTQIGLLKLAYLLEHPLKAAEK